MKPRCFGKFTIGSEICFMCSCNKDCDLEFMKEMKHKVMAPTRFKTCTGKTYAMRNLFGPKKERFQ